MKNNLTYKFGGIELSLITLTEAADNILNPVDNGSHHVHLVAASTFYGIEKNMLVQDSLKSGTVLCDSKPLSTWITFIFQKCEQIRGVDLLREVLKKSDKRTGHFFLGTTISNLEKLKTSVESQFPQIRFSGFLAPPFITPSPEVLRGWANEINQSGADLVWLSLGSPKQDIVAAELSKFCDAKIIAIGAALDFISGSKAEAPAFIQNLHLEWLFRLLHEPKRLWKRYSIGNVFFLMLVVKDLINKLKASVNRV